MLNMIDQIYSLRKNFMVIGLTGRTGSGCTTVADLLTNEITYLRSNHKDFREGDITNQVRKDRIIRNFIKHNWSPFIKITASDIIYYYAGLISFDEFVEELAKASTPLGDIRKSKKILSEDEVNKHLESHLQTFKNEFENFRQGFAEFSEEIKKVERIFDTREYQLPEKIQEGIVERVINLLTSLREFRNEIEDRIMNIDKGILSPILQTFGNNIRTYDSIVHQSGQENGVGNPTAIAQKINKFIKCIRALNEHNGNCTRIVIDALRNPFEILYFRERYSGFYCMSVNTTKEIRYDKLLKEKHFRIEEIEELDRREDEKVGLKEAYQKIDVIKCIQLSDIYLSHKGDESLKNRSLINQLLTYVSLILHPGLVPPTPEERIMQIAFTAKLNSGCLSRQVGAAVTDKDYSLKSIGWNSVPEGQVPCSLRQLDDLIAMEDPDAFSDFEKGHSYFYDYAKTLHLQYNKSKREKLNGLPLTYCFKNIHTRQKEKQLYNQVHTRSLHAEENAFLQLVKYGAQSVKGGKLFTTASCCELCAKKAYHLGISEIFYIDSYPGISNPHIFQSGKIENRPKIILFSGAVGRAYINLYNPFLSLKDEIEHLTNVEVGKKYDQENINKNK